MAGSAADAKGSVHCVTTNCGLVATCVTDSAAGRGEQVVTSTSEGNATFVILPDMAYFKADAQYLSTWLKYSAKSASTYAGQWISVPSANGLYAQIASPDITNSVSVPAPITFESLFANMLPVATPATPLAFTKKTTFDGKKVVGVSGSVATGAFGTGTQVVYISTASPYLPVGGTETVTGFFPGGTPEATGTFTSTYSEWGKPVSVSPPTSTIPISSVNSLQ